MVIGYTSGVFDLFHIGHLNILRNSESMCDKLIVGVSTDEVVKLKVRQAIIPFNERIEIVRSNKYVDVAIPQNSRDKIEIWNKVKFNVLFVGDDWFSDEKWTEYESFLNSKKVKIIYFPYTSGTSSTIINDTLNKLRI